MAASIDPDALVDELLDVIRRHQGGGIAVVPREETAAAVVGVLKALTGTAITTIAASSLVTRDPRRWARDMAALHGSAVARGVADAIDAYLAEEAAGEVRAASGVA